MPTALTGLMTSMSLFTVSLLHALAPRESREQHLGVAGPVAAPACLGEQRRGESEPDVDPHESDVQQLCDDESIDLRDDSYDQGPGGGEPPDAAGGELGAVRGAGASEAEGEEEEDDSDYVPSDPSFAEDASEGEDEGDDDNDDYAPSKPSASGGASEGDDRGGGGQRPLR
jgi:hypothetical protein